MGESETNAERIRRTVGVIPIGRVSSYGVIADLAGLPGRARLVGHVLRHTVTPSLLPWQRVLRSDGRLAFPADSTPARKQTSRLQDEDVVVINGRVNMQRFGWQPDLAELLMKLGC